MASASPNVTETPKKPQNMNKPHAEQRMTLLEASSKKVKKKRKKVKTPQSDDNPVAVEDELVTDQPIPVPELNNCFNEPNADDQKPHHEVSPIPEHSKARRKLPKADEDDNPTKFEVHSGLIKVYKSRMGRNREIAMQMSKLQTKNPSHKRQRTRPAAIATTTQSEASDAEPSKLCVLITADKKHEVIAQPKDTHVEVGKQVQSVYYKPKAPEIGHGAERKHGAEQAEMKEMNREGPNLWKEMLKDIKKETEMEVGKDARTVRETEMEKGRVMREKRNDKDVAKDAESRKEVKEKSGKEPNPAMECKTKDWESKREVRKESEATRARKPEVAKQAMVVKEMGKEVQRVRTDGADVQNKREAVTVVERKETRAATNKNVANETVVDGKGVEKEVKKEADMAKKSERGSAKEAEKESGSDAKDATKEGAKEQQDAGKDRVDDTQKDNREMTPKTRDEVLKEVVKEQKAAKEPAKIVDTKSK